MQFIKGPQLYLNRHRELCKMCEIKIRIVDSAIQQQNFVPFYTCMCFITAMFHFFHDIPVSLHVLKPVQIYKENPHFLNTSNKFSFQII